MKEMKKGSYDPTVGVTNMLEGEIQGRASSHCIIVGPSRPCIRKEFRESCFGNWEHAVSWARIRIASNCWIW